MAVVEAAANKIFFCSGVVVREDRHVVFFQFFR